MHMEQKQAESIFILAGFRTNGVKPLIDGYGSQPEHEDFWQKPPRGVWWFIKTEWGWIEIGCRKRVISIDWTDTGLSASDLTDDNTTKSEFCIHAWSTLDAVKYLGELRVRLMMRDAQQPAK